jgi:hypothetical protein
MKWDLNTASDGEWLLASERLVVLPAFTETPHNLEDVARGSGRSTN